MFLTSTYGIIEKKAVDLLSGENRDYMFARKSSEVEINFQVAVFFSSDKNSSSGTSSDLDSCDQRGQSISRIKSKEECLAAIQVLLGLPSFVNNEVKLKNTKGVANNNFKLKYESTGSSDSYSYGYECFITPILKDRGT